MPDDSKPAAADGSARLRSLARGGTWLKGAVNYDEDLHFSTYYLRASCAHVTRQLYPGYTALVASYEGFNETYYLLKDECHRSAAGIVERALKRPEWLPEILAQIRRRSDALEKIFAPNTSPEALQEHANEKLLALYCRHDLRNRELYRVARLPEALDRGESYFTGYLMDALRARGLSEDACGDAFAVLSEPSVPSVLALEILAFDDIVQCARKISGTPLGADGGEGSGRARMFLAPEVMRRLEEHRREWQFLPYHGYGHRQAATLDHYIARMLEQIANPGKLAGAHGLKARFERSAKRRHALLKRLKLDRAHAALFEVYPEIGAAKLYRRHAQLRNFYFLDMLLAEIARRLRVSEWTVRCMLPEEIMASLKAVRLTNPAVAERLGGCVFTIINGRESVLSGKAMLDARALFQTAAHTKNTGGVLRGTVACRGKAAGPCKVIIRADDCRGALPKGMIVASESTDPDLLRFLRAASGVLTEQGGVTSHAAIICRELGIPTIIGVEGLLQRVRDGDWIQLDAERGEVKVTANACAANSAAQISKPSSARPSSEVGAKAHNLGVVRAHGFKVPQFTLLDFKSVRRAAGGLGSTFSSGLIQKTLDELGVTNGEKLAVRSSAICEDAESGSCAGKFRSLLDIGRDELGAALREFSESNGGAAYRGSVIVQRMVESDCAGVCLTRDNRTGNRDAVIIEMTAGGNSGVTGGTARPGRVVVDRLTGDILDEERVSEALLGQSIDIAGLVRQFLTLEARFGKPLDIEWALAQGELYILQARPIVETHRVETNRAEIAGANASKEN